VEAAATIDLATVLKCKICNANPRTGRGAHRRANASKAFSGAAVIDRAEEEASAGADVAEAGAGVDDDKLMAGTHL